MLFIRVKLPLVIWDREAIILPIMRIFVRVGLNEALVIDNPCCLKVQGGTSIRLVEFW